MSDRYSDFVQSPMGKKVAQNLGLPMPVALERYKDGQAPITGSVLFGASQNAIASGAIAEFLSNVKADVYLDSEKTAQTAITANHITAKNFVADALYKVAIFDATGIGNVAELKQVYNFFHPIARSIEKSGRVIVVGLPLKNATALSNLPCNVGLKALSNQLAKSSNVALPLNWFMLIKTAWQIWNPPYAFLHRHVRRMCLDRWCELAKANWLM